MKTFKLFSIATVVSLSSMTFFADAVEKTKTVSDGTSITLNNDRGKPRPNRPKTPARQIITCIYDNGELTFDFVLPEGMCEVVLTENTGAAMSYTVDSSDLTATVFVGTIGESEIELTTENGNTYTGILTAE